MLSSLKAKLILVIAIITIVLIVSIIFVTSNGFEKILNVTESAFKSIQKTVSEGLKNTNKETNALLNNTLRGEIESIISNIESSLKNNLENFKEDLMKEIIKEAQKQALDDVSKKVNSRVNLISSDIQAFVFNYVKGISILPSLKNFYESYEFDPITAEAIGVELGNYFIDTNKRNGNIFSKFYLLSSDGYILLDVSNKGEILFDTGDVFDEKFVETISKVSKDEALVYNLDHSTLQFKIGIPFYISNDLTGIIALEGNLSNLISPKMLPISKNSKIFLLDISGNVLYPHESRTLSYKEGIELKGDSVQAAKKFKVGNLYFVFFVEAPIKDFKSTLDKTIAGFVDKNLKDINNELGKQKAKSVNNLEKVLEDVSERSNEAIEKVNNALEKEMEKSKNYIYNEKRNAYKALIITGFIFVGLGILAAFLLGNVLSKGIDKLKITLDKVRNGDLRTVDVIKGKSEIASISVSIKETVNGIRTIVERIVNTSSDLSNAIETLSKVSDDLYESSNVIRTSTETVLKEAQSTSAAVEEVTAGVEEVAASSKDVSDLTNELARTSEEVSRSASEGRKEVRKIVESISQISLGISETANKVKDLTEFTSSIEGIIDTILSIAEQTNLLALNAAIEAARAGEVGKGFAVVAEEIRELAEESKQATDKIAQILNSTKKYVESINEKVANVVGFSESTKTDVQEVGRKLDSILSQIENIDDMIMRVNEVSSLQSKSASEISKAINDVSLAMEKVVESITSVSGDVKKLVNISEKVKETADRLSNVDADLSTLIRRFKIQ